MAIIRLKLLAAETLDHVLLRLAPVDKMSAVEGRGV